MAEKIPEQKETQERVTNNFFVTERKSIGSGALIDWILTAVLIVMMFFISASYFVNFGGSFQINIKKSATDTAWVAIAILCVKELAKHIFRRKGQRTVDYDKAEKKANKAIQTLNENVDSGTVQAYCDDVTKKTIERYREYQLTTVGLTLKTFESDYLGKGSFSLLKPILSGKLSFLQVRAIWRCNHLKTKPYNPRFITSYNADDNSELVPSQQNDPKKADMRHSAKALFFAFGSAFGVGFVFNDIFLNFSKEMLFLAIIKIILLIVSFALSAMIGWNLSLIEKARNESRASEAKACMKHAGVDMNVIHKIDEDDKNGEEKE